MVALFLDQEGQSEIIWFHSSQLTSSSFIELMSQLCSDVRRESVWEGGELLAVVPLLVLFAVRRIACAERLFVSISLVFKLRALFSWQFVKLS